MTVGQTINNNEKQWHDLFKKSSQKIQKTKGTNIKNNETLSNIVHLEDQCKNKNMAGCYMLGILYESGNGVKQNYSKSASFYLKACNNGHSSACDYLTTITALLNKESTLLITENQNKINQLQENIDNQLKNLVTNKVGPEHKAWSTETIEETSKALYGNIMPIQSEKITINIPKIASNWDSILLRISTSIEAKSIAVLTNGNNKSLVSIFQVHQDTIASFGMTIRIMKKNSANIVVIVQDINGSLHIAKTEIDIANG